MKTAFPFGDDYFSVVVRAPVAVRRRCEGSAPAQPISVDFGFSLPSNRLGTGTRQGNAKSSSRVRRSVARSPFWLRSL